MNLPPELRAHYTQRVDFASIVFKKGVLGYNRSC
jgi:hypothetical protein